MTELALTTSTSAERYSWVTIEQAVQLTGLSAGQLRRKCGEEWAAQGLAKTEQGDGTRSQWKIRSDADPRLQVNIRLAGKETAIVPVAKADALMMNSAAMKNAMRRAAILDRWEKAKRAARVLGMTDDQATGAFLIQLAAEFTARGLGGCPSRPTLYRWQQAGECGVAGLADGRQRRSETKQLAAKDDPFFECVKRLWGTTNKNKLSKCYDTALYLAREKGWDIRSRDQVRRFIEKMDRREKILLREGKEAFVNEVMPHEIGDYSTLEANELWVSDHHQFDVWVKVGERLDPKSGGVGGGGKLVPIHKRCWLTVWMDMRSRKIVGWMIRPEPANMDVVLQTLAIGCDTHYIPFGVYTDNGRDFDHSALTGETKAQHQAKRGNRQREGYVAQPGDGMRQAGIYAALRIKHSHAIPYHPQSKPVERFFETVCDRFSRTWPTYCGNSPENRPEGLLTEKGVVGRLERGLAPTLEDFRKAFSLWVENDYHHRVHTGNAMNDTPANVWQANLRTMRTAPRELLDLLMQPRIECRVNQLGVCHQKITYGRYLLNPFIGQDVYIRVNNADVSAVSVWTKKDEFIGIAPSNQLLPRNATSQQVREALAEQRRHAKALSESFQARLRMHYDVPTLMLAAAAEKAEAEVAANPLPPTPDVAILQPVRSDLESQLPALRIAYEDRTAAEPAAEKSLSLSAAAAAYGVDE